MLNNSIYVFDNQGLLDLLSKELVTNIVYNFAKDEANFNKIPEEDEGVYFKYTGI
jgi:hypothetical protein